MLSLVHAICSSFRSIWMTCAGVGASVTPLSSLATPMQVAVPLGAYDGDPATIFMTVRALRGAAFHQKRRIKAWRERRLNLSQYECWGGDGGCEKRVKLNQNHELRLIHRFLQHRHMYHFLYQISHWQSNFDNCLLPTSRRAVDGNAYGCFYPLYRFFCSLP